MAADKQRGNMQALMACMNPSLQLWHHNNNGLLSWVQDRMGRRRPAPVVVLSDVSLHCLPKCRTECTTVRRRDGVH